MKQTRIITKGNVTKNFDNKDCRVMRTITNSSKSNGIVTYKIRTNYCYYKDVIVPDLDENLVQKIDDEGNLITKIKQELVIGKQKDSLSTFVVDELKKDYLWNLIKDNISLNDSLYEFDLKVEQNALLTQTVIDNPWGYGADKWEILN